MPFSAQFTCQKKEALAKGCTFPLVELYYRHAVEMGIAARLGFLFRNLRGKAELLPHILAEFRVSDA